jgi:hypothetical protein
VKHAIEWRFVVPTQLYKKPFGKKRRRAFCGSFRRFPELLNLRRVQKTLRRLPSPIHSRHPSRR